VLVDRPAKGLDADVVLHAGVSGPGVVRHALAQLGPGADIGTVAEVIKRTAALMKWQARPSPGADTSAAIARGRGISFVHYKQSETYVAMGMEVAVERASGKIKVERVVCAHDCGQIINPDGVRAQVEGSILQTLSRVLLEEVKFDRSRVLSIDWASYPILRFSDMPKLDIELVDRPNEPPLAVISDPRIRSRVRTLTTPASAKFPNSALVGPWRTSMS